MEVDISGTMVKATPGWEERVEELCKPENFFVGVTCKLPISKDGPLSDEEWRRLNKKLKLVEEWGRYMAAGMLKGCVKYPSDSWELEQWFAHAIGEGADYANYQVLMFNKWREEQRQEIS